MDQSSLGDLIMKKVTTQSNLETTFYSNLVKRV